MQGADSRLGSSLVLGPRLRNPDDGSDPEALNPKP